MKGIVSVKRRRCMVRVTVFLIVATLIAGMVGCGNRDGGDGETESIAMVAAGSGGHIIGLRADGTAVAAGNNTYGQCNIDSWTDIIHVAAGHWHTVGVKADGTVIATGWNDYGQCDVAGWTDIVQVAAGLFHTVGVKSDGTVVATTISKPSDDDGQCDVADWTDIAQVSAAWDHTVGLKADGTVVATGDNYPGQGDVSEWTDITQVAAGYYHMVGLKSDGTAVAVGANWTRQCDVDSWTDIVQVAACSDTFGLKSDGTVVNVYGYHVGGWTDIIQISANGWYTVGLKSDGSVVAQGDKLWGQCAVDGWTDIDQVAACGAYTVGVKSDGTTVTGGAWDCRHAKSLVDVGNWTQIVGVAGSMSHTVGLRSDGTVVAEGFFSWWRDYGQLEVGDWVDIIQVAAGGEWELGHTVGLKSDGTVIAVGRNEDGQCDVGNWTDITQVAAGIADTLGLKSDGTVIATGWNDYGQCDVIGWTDIVQVAAGYIHTVGVKADGTVVANTIGDPSYDYGQCDVTDWKDIVQVAAGYYHTVGLKADGTVVATTISEPPEDYGQCDVADWIDIIQVAAGDYHTVGLRSDGTVVAAGIGAELYKWNLGTTRHDLNISSTTGGSVTAPGEGVFTYGAGTVANLVAKPEEGYQFVRWTGDTGTVDSINAESTRVAIWGDYVITANFAMPPIRYNLNVGSTAGGSVVAPGEGTFSNERGTVVELVAEPEEGYQFLNWTGDVETVTDVDSPSTTVSTDGDYYIRANFAAVEVDGIGVTVGDWMKVEYEITGWPTGEPYPEWLKLEFLSIEGTNATVLVTMHMSDGTEQSETAYADIGEGGGQAFGLAGFVISANLMTGDSVYISGYGDVTIDGETTRTYAGAERTVLYATFSEYGVQMTYYWDGDTGVLLEASSTSADLTATAVVTETNLW
jgi:alpha-tubulin suppressor-like RCC1 family protein